MMGLSERMDLLAMVSNVYWYGHALKREGDHVLRRVFQFEV